MLDDYLARQALLDEVLQYIPDGARAEFADMIALCRIAPEEATPERLEAIRQVLADCAAQMNELAKKSAN